VRTCDFEKKKILSLFVHFSSGGAAAGAGTEEGSAVDSAAGTAVDSAAGTAAEADSADVVDGDVSDSSVYVRLFPRHGDIEFRPA
jgi:hypothetical protein